MNKGEIRAVLRLLKRGERTTDEIVLALESTNDEILPTLGLMKRRGLVQFDAGCWSLTAKGRARKTTPAKMGPPRKPKSEVLVSAPSRMTRVERAKAKRIGGGNLSAGIREAVRRAGGSVK